MSLGTTPITHASMTRCSACRMCGGTSSVLTHDLSPSHRLFYIPHQACVQQLSEKIPYVVFTSSQKLKLSVRDVISQEGRSDVAWVTLVYANGEQS